LKKIVVDLDGTLSLLPTGSRDFANAKPNLELISELIKLKEKGFKLILSTARGDQRRGTDHFSMVAPEVEAEVFNWLTKNNLTDLFDEIQIGLKSYAELYVDDKGIPPQAFAEGITDAERWAGFCQSDSFRNCVKSYTKPDKHRHFNL
jgi:capsule biosynthesis phosphatase